MIKAKLTRDFINRKPELHVWVEKDNNEWEISELIRFVDGLKNVLEVRNLDSVDYEDIKVGWAIKNKILK